MVLNVVLHRLNIDHVEEILGMAERMGAEYVELANTQYYGWAWRNRAQLLPSRDAAAARGGGHRPLSRARGRRACAIFFVVPDYFETRPKPCMSGLGRVFLGIAPDGSRAALPGGADAAGTRLPERARRRASAPSGTTRPHSTAIAARAWMKEPCRSCPERGRDFGGCRCQAYLLTGDAANADPVCGLSPHHHLVTEAVARAEAQAAGAALAEPLVFRDHRGVAARE